MPVLVTGADDGLGSRVVEQLLDGGGEVRAYLDATVSSDGDAVDLRSLGVKVALGELDDEGHLEAALEQVHTVAHCWGGPLCTPDELVEVAATLASAALGAGVRRLVWVRELSDGPGNPYLDALSEVAELFDALPIETVTLATGVRHAAGDPFTERLAGGWLSGTGVDPAAPHAPVHLDDVARAVVVADRDRGGGSESHLRLGLVGPEVIALSELLRRLRAPRLDGAPPSDLPDPPPWVPDWLSRGAPGTSGVVDGVPIPVAHGVDPLAPR